MAAAGGDLVAAVDAVVAEDLSVLSVPALQQQYAAIAPQVQRLTGFGGAVLAELGRRGAGQVPTEQGRTRSLPGWAAEASGNSSGATGRLLRVASALQAGLPGVAQAVLDGRLPFVRAEVLTRRVGRIDAGALAGAEPELLAVAQQMDPVQLAAYVRHQLATWVEPVLDDDAAARSATSAVCDGAGRIAHHRLVVPELLHRPEPPLRVAHQRDPELPCSERDDLRRAGPVRIRRGRNCPLLPRARPPVGGRGPWRGACAPRRRTGGRALRLVSRRCSGASA